MQMNFWLEIVWIGLTVLIFRLSTYISNVHNFTKIVIILRQLGSGNNSFKLVKAILSSIRHLHEKETVFLTLFRKYSSKFWRNFEEELHWFTPYFHVSRINFLQISKPRTKKVPSTSDCCCHGNCKQMKFKRTNIVVKFWEKCQILTTKKA
jgi:hypothetical protein